MCSYNRAIQLCISFSCLVDVLGIWNPLVLVSRKKKIAEKPNGGNPDYLKMTSFAEIVRVADRQKISDALQKY